MRRGGSSCPLWVTSGRARIVPSLLLLESEDRKLGGGCISDRESVRTVALAPFVIRCGPDASSDVLRCAARCTVCGHRGAMLKFPTCRNHNDGVLPLPVGRMNR